MADQMADLVVCADPNAPCFPASPGVDEIPGVDAGSQQEIAVALRPGMVADAIVAALDEAIPWWRHLCPPEFLAQGKDPRAYKAWGL